MQWGVPISEVIVEQEQVSSKPTQIQQLRAVLYDGFGLYCLMWETLQHIHGHI